jgi:hypothetical protein
MKTLIMVVAMMVSFSNVYAMRCSNQLINEGDSITRMLNLCGNPQANTRSNIVYINKDGDGIDYYIHADAMGTIDSIQFSRH